jgi:hypothetical protein
MYRTNPESWLHQDSKMVPCAQCTHNAMMLWLSVAFIEYTEYVDTVFDLPVIRVHDKNHAAPN